MKAIFLILISVFTACNSTSDFYSQYAVEDLWRLPLIEPYELRNLKVSEENYSDVYDWNLKLRHGKNQHKFKHLNISKVNVKHGIIFGYGESYPTGYFVIDTRNGREIIFETRSDWEVFLKKESVDAATIKEAWDVFDGFKNKGILPWINEGKPE